MNLLIATCNPAKFKRYQAILSTFPAVRICSPGELGITITIDESGATAAENARLKAGAFGAAAGVPALGIDEPLFIPALPPEEQPGVMVRRNGGKRLDDEALLAFYLDLARRLAPDQRAVHWVYALCLALPGGKTFAGEAGLDGWLTDSPVLPYSPGYPLSAILLDGETRKPLRSMTEAELRCREAPLYQAVGNLMQQWLPHASG